MYLLLRLHFFIYTLTYSVIAVRNYDLVVEKTERVLVDQLYTDISGLKVSRFNRSHTMIDGDFTTSVVVDDSFMVDIQAFEKVGSQYRPSLINIKNKTLCSVLYADFLANKDFLKSSNLPKSCPIPAGKYTVDHFLTDPERFPEYMPGYKWRFDVTILKDEVALLHYQIFCRIDRKNIVPK